MKDELNITQLIDTAYEVELIRVLLVRKINIEKAKVEGESGRNNSVGAHIFTLQNQLEEATRKSDESRIILKKEFGDNYDSIMNLVESRVNIYLANNDVTALSSHVDTLSHYIKEESQRENQSSSDVDFPLKKEGERKKEELSSIEKEISDFLEGQKNNKN